MRKTILALSLLLIAIGFGIMFFNSIVYEISKTSCNIGIFLSFIGVIGIIKSIPHLIPKRQKPRISSVQDLKI
jgi:hypothetical protein